MATAETAPGGGARERILSAAYDLFSQRGIQAVGIDAIIEESGVARQTLYRNFASKEELVLAFLERREARWTNAWLRREVELRAREPRERLLAIFDVFDDWFHTATFEGCSFINVMLEHPDPKNAIHRASVMHLAGIRDFLRALTTQVGVDDPDDLA